AGRADPGSAGRAAGAVRTQRLPAGLPLGHQCLRPVGCRTRQAHRRRPAIATGRTGRTRRPHHPRPRRRNPRALDVVSWPRESAAKPFSGNPVPGQGPGDVFADEFAGMVAAGGEGGDDPGGAGGIAEGDGDVAQPAFIAGATDGRTFGALQELFLAPGEQLDQAGPVQAVADAEVGFRIAHRELVPGADQLAVVAAEDAVADQGPQFLGDAAAQFDGQVADAAAGVDAVGRHDRPGRADVDAAAAGAAMGAGRFVHRQRQVGEQLAEEEPAAAAAVDQATVLADPAQAGIAGQGAFQYRSRIHEHAVAEVADLRGDAVGQLLQALAQQLVVVAAQGVAGDVGAFTVGKGGPGPGVVAGAV